MIDDKNIDHHILALKHAYGSLEVPQGKTSSAKSRENKTKFFLFFFLKPKYFIQLNTHTASHGFYLLSKLI